MKIVVDANILVSFFRPNPVREIISTCSFLQLFSPEYVLEELTKPSIKDAILKYSGLTLEQFDLRLSQLTKFVRIVPKGLYNEFEAAANKLSPHGKQTKDDPYFALALKLDCPIWSNESAFKQQSKVRVFSTRDIIELFA